MTEVTKDVGLARIVKPKFLSLVGVPANQVAFKTIRDDSGEPVMTAPHIQRKRAVRRSENLVCIDFDVATSDDDIKTTMDDWGIADYTIETADKYKRVKCSDAGEKPTMSVNLGEGRVATVLKPISRAEADAKTGVAVVRMEFAADYFPAKEDVSAWCASHSVDFSQDAFQNGPECSVVRRNVKVGKEDETRKIQVDDGVQFVVARADELDIPGEFVAVVNDAAYGNWGWGQLDFAATMADVEFCNVSSEAIHTLNRVVDRILFYNNELPINVRKELIARAATQFSDYIVTLMDALPTRVVIASRSTKEKSMSKEKPTGEAVTRTEAAPATTAAPASAPATEAAPAAAPEAAPATEGALTRGDVQKMIDGALGGVSSQIAELSAKLAPAAPATETRSDAAPASEAAPAGELQEVLRSIGTLADAVNGMKERVESLEGSTTVRSDDADPKQTKQRKDVFKGMFGSKQS